MEEVGVGAAAVLPGAPQPTFCRTSASERRMRKSGSANIFQGVNLRQLRRLFHSAGEPDAEQKARQVWRNRRRAEGDEEDRDGDEAPEEGEEDEEDEGLAQALVGLRVRARTRSGIRAETSRGVRALGHSRSETSRIKAFSKQGNEISPELWLSEHQFLASHTGCAS